MKKNYLAGLISLAFGVLAFLDGPDGGGAGASIAATVEAPLSGAVLSDGDVELTIPGEAVTPVYPFNEKLAAAINEGIGDTTTDNPGAVVVQEFTRWLNERGIGPEVFAALTDEQDNATTASDAEAN